MENTKTTQPGDKPLKDITIANVEYVAIDAPFAVHKTDADN